MDLDTLYKEIVNTSRSDYHRRTKSRIAYTWEKIYPLISAGSTIVEIGVGPMSVLAKQFGAAEVIGVDLNKNQAALCNKFNIELRTCDLQTEPLPLEDESADMIMFLEIIEHLCIYPNYVLSKMYRKLKAGGYLVVSTVNFIRISNRIRVLCGRNPLINYFEPSEDGRNHIREFVLSEVSHYMENSGLSIEKTYRFGAPAGRPHVSMLLRLAYMYPRFRNYFMIIGKK